MDSQQALTLTDKLYAKLTARRGEVEKFDDYFRGKHKLAYATDEWAAQHAVRFKGFSDNWCGVVGSAAPERTKINGIRLGDDTDVLSADERLLWRDWEVNDGPVQASQGFLQSTIAKRSFTIVWGDDNDEPTLSWERPDQVLVDYQPGSRRKTAAIKAWVDGDVEYATLYEPAALWKWQRKAGEQRTEPTKVVTGSGLIVPATVKRRMDTPGKWVPRQDPDDDVWPVPNPLGRVPVSEWQNRPMLGGEPLSDIAGAMAMQDAINLLWGYLFTSADWASMPARVVMGQAPPKIPILDSSGQKIGEKEVDEQTLKRGRLLWLTGQSTSIGQWEAAKLDVFTDVVMVAVKHMAAQTRTPIHYILGELGNVNGETLTATDNPLNQKVRQSHEFYTGPARETFELFALVRGNDRLAEACRTASMLWKNPEIVSDAQRSDAALKDKQVGFSLATILQNRYGMTQVEAANEIERVKVEQSDPVLEQLARTVSSSVVAAPGVAAGG